MGFEEIEAIFGEGYKKWSNTGVLKDMSGFYDVFYDFLM